MIQQRNHHIGRYISACQCINQALDDTIAYMWLVYWIVLTFMETC